MINRPMPAMPNPIRTSTLPIFQRQVTTKDTRDTTETALRNWLLTKARIKTDELDLVSFGIVEIQRAPLDPFVVVNLDCQPQIF